MFLHRYLYYFQLCLLWILGEVLHPIGRMWYSAVFSPVQHIWLVPLSRMFPIWYFRSVYCSVRFFYLWYLLQTNIACPPPKKKKKEKKKKQRKCIISLSVSVFVKRNYLKTLALWCFFPVSFVLIISVWI